MIDEWQLSRAVIDLRTFPFALKVRACQRVSSNHNYTYIGNFIAELSESQQKAA